MNAEINEALYEDLCRQDIWSMAKDGESFARRLRKLPNGKCRLNTVATARVDSPWCHNTINADRACDLWHEVYFGQFGFVPRGCRDCRKISMALASVYDLFLINAFQATFPKWEGKCGVDRRRYTPARYAAFWYVPMGYSLEEARAYYQEILAKLKEWFSPRALYPWKIILKRGCTEMEQRTQKDHGLGSDAWDDLFVKSDPLEDRLEQLFEDNAELYETEQSQETKRYILRYWVEYAYAINDPTASLLDADGSLQKNNPPMLAYEAHEEGWTERMQECRTRLKAKA